MPAAPASESDRSSNDVTSKTSEAQPEDSASMAVTGGYLRRILFNSEWPPTLCPIVVNKFSLLDGLRKGRGLNLCVSTSLQVILFKAIYAAGDAIPEHGFAKVEQVSRFQAGEAEISLDLLLTRGRHTFDRLQLQQHPALHDEVAAESVFQGEVPANNGHRHQTFAGKSAQCEFLREDNFIHGLQQTGAEFAVDIDGGGENECADFVFGQGAIFPQRR